MKRAVRLEQGTGRYIYTMSTFEELKDWLNETPGEVEAEKLILEVSELILEKMEQANISHTELARRLGKSKSHVSRLLRGDRNMTLRTLAEVCYSLSYRASLNLQPLETVEDVEQTAPDQRIERPVGA